MANFLISDCVKEKVASFSHLFVFSHPLFWQLKQNVVNVDLHISRYAQIVEELRAEVLSRDLYVRIELKM